jgi:hypothetical protein
MPELVNLHEAQDGNQVHEGRVELEKKYNLGKMENVDHLSSLL